MILNSLSSSNCSIAEFFLENFNSSSWNEQVHLEVKFKVFERSHRMDNALVYMNTPLPFYQMLVSTV